jgi:hypothetical protein
LIELGKYLTNAYIIFFARLFSFGGFMDLTRPFRTAKYYFKKLFNPYNRIKLPISNEYHEPDDMLFYVMRAILIDFVEKEKCFVDWFSQNCAKPLRHTDIELMQHFIDSYEEKNAIGQEILDLYVWFKVTHPELEKELDELKTEHWYERKQILYNLETKKLIRLVELRAHLWT